MIELPDLITIPAGRFVMGTLGEDRFANSTERPAHEVVIERPFAVSRSPITEAQWSTFAGGSSSSLPVVRVSWWEAMKYVAWLSAQTGKLFRLLTEAEWEYACRAGSTSIFNIGDTLEPEHANYFYDEHGFKVGPGCRTPPGSYPPNAFGLEDMHGNVCEWVSDAWRANYDAAPDVTYRVIRGGAWDYMPRLLRCAWRDFGTPDTKRDNLGFRIACDL
jgi:formylglycine-generating enzyme required for sulfatase activity